MNDIVTLKDISHVTVFLKNGRNIKFSLLEYLQVNTQTNIDEVMDRIMSESDFAPPFRPPLPGEIEAIYILELKANQYKVIKEKKMDNKQLALLLRSIAKNIDALANEIEPFIEQGLRQDVWVLVGQGPEPGPFDTRRFSGKDYELRPEGEFVAVKLVREFAEQLREEANMLTEEKDDD